MTDNTFWIENPSLLFEKDELKNFVPTKEMTIIQKMNAITRLCIYGIILGYMFNFRDNIMYILFIIIILTIISYKISNKQKNEDEDIHKLFTSQQLDSLSDKLSDKLSEILVEKNTPINVLENFNKCSNNNNSPDNSMNETPINKEINDNIKVKLELPNEEKDKLNNENAIKIQEECKKPTKDNPLMNINIGDHPQNPPACQHTSEIKENINDKFNYNLYQDVDDQFEKHNSQRQFYTTPNTSMPNDQTKFAEWLYKPAHKTCKESSLCLKNEDKRYYK